MENNEPSLATLLTGAHWPQLAAHIGNLLGAAHCAIVLGEGGRPPRAYGRVRRVHKVASAMLAPGGSPRVLHYDAAACTLFVPVCVDGVVAGVLHVQGSVPMTEQQIDSCQMIALLIGKALHVGRLQRILHSRFAQLALMPRPPHKAIALAHSRDTAALMAKAFYKEMANAGFPAPDIIGAASDIIGELTHALKSEKSTRGTFSNGAGPLP